MDSWTALPTRGCLGAAGVRGDNNGFAAAFLREILTFAAGCLAAGRLAAGWLLSEQTAGVLPQKNWSSKSLMKSWKSQK